jgi:hypothetical protein
MMTLTRRLNYRPPTPTFAAIAPARGVTVAAPSPDPGEHANHLYLVGFVNTNLLVGGWITS